MPLDPPAEVARLWRLAAAVDAAAAAREAALFRRRVPAARVKGFADPLSAYAREVINGIAETTPPQGEEAAATVPGWFRYEGLVPLALTTADGATPTALATYAARLYASHIQRAMTAVTVAALAAVARDFAAAASRLDAAPLSHLRCWSVAVATARSGGGALAAVHAAQIAQLVGPEILAEWASLQDEEDEDEGAVAAASRAQVEEAFAAPLRPLGGGESAAVLRLFSRTDPSELPPPYSAELLIVASSVHAAAAASSYLGGIVPEAAFAHVFTFNRGLVTSAAFDIGGGGGEDNNGGDSGESSFSSSSSSPTPALTSTPTPATATDDPTEAALEGWPLATLVAALVEQPRLLRSEGVTEVARFTPRPPRVNILIWREEIAAEPAAASVEGSLSSSSVDYHATRRSVSRSIGWCGIATLGVVYAVSTFELLSGVRE